MNDQPFLQTSFASALSRRDFLTQAGLTMGVFTLPYALNAAVHPPQSTHARHTTHHAPVVSLHGDQPYIDITGTALPHLACCMTGAAWPLAAMNEMQLRMQHPYL